MPCICQSLLCLDLVIFVLFLCACAVWYFFCLCRETRLHLHLNVSLQASPASQFPKSPSVPRPLQAFSFPACPRLSKPSVSPPLRASPCLSKPLHRGRGLVSFPFRPPLALPVPLGRRARARVRGRVCLFYTSYHAYLPLHLDHCGLKERRSEGEEIG